MNLKLPSVYWTQVFVFASLKKCDLIASCFLIYQEPMSGAHTLYLLSHLLEEKFPIIYQFSRLLFNDS